MLFNVQQSGKVGQKVEGAEYDAAIYAYLAEFRAEASGTQQLSELEDKVVRLLSQQTEVLRYRLAYHWQYFKVVESAVPLCFLASDTLMHGTRPRDDSNAPWANIHAVYVQKRPFCIQRQIGIFLNSSMN